MNGQIAEGLGRISPQVEQMYRGAVQEVFEAAEAASSTRKSVIAYFYAQEAAGQGVQRQLRDTVNLLGSVTSGKRGSSTAGSSACTAGL